MASQDFKRKLTAILSADVEGYSRLMAEDEETTVQTITLYREVMTTLIQQHRGKVVDSPGDNVLAEFTSVVDAVQCAVSVQKEISSRNNELPENRQMHFRIGINLGDVIEEGERIYGDGVNIAARLEGLAEPGGICISKTAFDHIESKLPYGYDFIGEQTVKNIPKPVGAYRVLMDPRVTVKGKLEEEKPLPARRTRILFGIAVVLVLVVAGGIWQFYIRRPSLETASVEKMAFPLPDKPSIAVLPFDNLSGDSGQDYFSDGITESIITALSNVSNLFVIARNSTFTYKGKPVKVQQVAQELGVRYVLEGSVQRSEDQVRITAQLIDSLTAYHLWAKRYDRKIDDIFTLQDDITEQVVTALEVKLTEGDQARMWRGKAANPEAYEYFLRGLEIYRSFTKEDNAQARKLWEKAAELDPNYAQAWLQVGWTHYRDGRFGWTDTPAKSLALAEELAKKTLTMDDSMSEAYSLLSLVHMARRQHDKAVAYGEKALASAPNLADLTATIGVTFLYSGRPEETIKLVRKAMRLSPYYPGWYLPVLGLAYRLTGQYKEAIDAMESWRTRANPRSALPHLALAYTYVEAGREDEAQDSVAEVLKLNPKASIKGYLNTNTFPYKNPAEIERVLKSLRKAGLPESPPLPLPDKPSIAVLPFDNLSGDPNQEYFSDGLTEEIIAALSSVPKLFVIARNSTFTYKGKPVKVQEVSRELGVRYILEGSVRKYDKQIRITAQLIDATTGNHIWAERYDRELKDIFAVQDEITKKIITAMQIKLTEGEQVRNAAKGTNNLKAYLKYLQANEYLSRNNIERNALAKQLAKEAIALDPEYAWAYYVLSTTYQADMWQGTTKSPKASLAKATELLQKAIALDNTFAVAYGAMGFLYAVEKQHDKALAFGEKAVALNPNSAEAHMMLGKVFVFAGKWEESIQEFKTAMRLNPIPPNRYLWSLGLSYGEIGKYEDAITWCEKAVRQEPDSFFAHLMLTAVYSWSGRDEDARVEAAEVLRINPQFSLEKLEKKAGKPLVEALRKAGLK